nr:hypothetical protein BaRGS_034665 [Batillaria attramentaria]
MLTSPGALVQGFLTLVTAVTVGRSSFAECPAGTFYNTEREECQTCATCPTNQIISKPCSERRDTICGPFNDFHGFHPAPRERLGDLPVPDEAADGGGKVNDGLDVNRSKKLPDNDEDVDEVFMDSRTDDDVDSEVPDPDGDASKGQKRGGKVDEDPDSATLIPASRPRHQDDEGPSMHNRDGAECQWKVLALALIVVLCVVCVFLIIFVFAVCYLRTRRAHLQKVLYSAVMCAEK